MSCYNNGNQKAYKGIISSVPEEIINEIKKIYNSINLDLYVENI